MGRHVGFAGNVAADIAEHGLHRPADRGIGPRPLPEHIVAALISISLAIGPLTMRSGAVVLVAVWMP